MSDFVTGHIWENNFWPSHRLSRDDVSNPETDTAPEFDFTVLLLCEKMQEDSSINWGYSIRSD